MSNVPRSPPLFTIRLWLEDLGHGQVEWCGAVKNLVSGETRYFREWSALGRLLPSMLDDDEGDWNREQ